jgi:TRAP-type C4-dicarboxylate transport system permease small subunit
MVVGGIDLVSSMLELGQESPVLRIRMGYVYLAVPISGFFLTLYAVIGLVERVRGLLKEPRRAAGLIRPIRPIGPISDHEQPTTAGGDN